MNRLDALLDLLKAEPGDLFLNYAVGVEYAAMGMTEKASGQFTRVLQLDESYIAAYYQMGKLLESMQENERALKFYQQGLEKAKLKKDNKAANEFAEAIFLLED